MVAIDGTSKLVVLILAGIFAICPWAEAQDNSQLEPDVVAEVCAQEATPSFGPDGHLWVADWYNFIIQHNPTPTVGRGGFEGTKGKGSAHENPSRDTQHGRIYRVKWEGATESSISSLDKASDKELVAALGHDNQFWRLTDQRLLVDNQRTDSIPALKKLVAEANGAEAAHALRD